MTSRSQEELHLRKTRRGRRDLIDFSDDVGESGGGNILDLFDPLTTSHNIKNQSNEPLKSNDKITTQTRQPLILRDRRDRRLRASSTCTIPTNHNRETTYDRSKIIQGNDKQHDNIISNTSDGSSNFSKSSAKESKTSSNSSASIENDINKLSSHSGASNHLDVSSEYVSYNRSNSSNDLSQAIRNEPFRESLRKNNKLQLSRKLQRSSLELVLFTNKIKSFRAQYKHHDINTNPGIVYSPTLYSSRVRGMSVKIIITSPIASSPINFTCNVSTTIEHLISHAVCSMFENLQDEDNMENYMIKVTGKDEYFDSKLCLADYATVSHCWKFDLDVQLTLVKVDNVKRSFLRTSKDDFRCKSLLCPDDLLSRTYILKFSDLNYEALNIIIDTFEREADRLYHDVTIRSTSVQTQSLLQTTKAICALMMSCETGSLTESKDNLAELCRSYKNEGKQLKDEDRYKMIEVIQHAIKRLLENMRSLLKLTSKSLPVDYEVLDLESAGRSNRSFVDTPIHLVKDQLSIKILLISQLKPDWLTKYQEFHIEICLKHGEGLICPSLKTSTIRFDTSFFPRLLFEESLTFSIQYSNLPRESRFVITLFGTEIPNLAGAANANQLNVPGSEEPIPIRRSVSATSISSTAPMYSSSPRGSQVVIGTHKPLGEPIQIALAVSVSYIFDHELKLYQGDRFIYMHPLCSEFDENVYIETIVDRQDPVLVMEYKKFPPEKKIYFPSTLDDVPTSQSPIEDLKSKGLDSDRLDPGAKHVIEATINEKQCYERLKDDEKALLWENRYYLTTNQLALPKVLLSAPNWSVTNLKDVYELVDTWEPMNAVDAIQLLLPTFPDAHVRKVAVNWISKQHDDELCDYLPQLVQAFRYERGMDCPLFWLLIERAIKNVRIANLLYWQLKLNCRDNLAQERSETIINCLLWICGSTFWKSIDRQEDLLNRLTHVSGEIKKVRDGQRMSVLHKKLEQVQDYLIENKPTIPFAPSIEVCDLELKSCSYFPSNTLPLKLALRSCEESCNKAIKFHTYDTIFKVGDDLRQDMLAIQMIKIMEKLWLREGLDLRMVTFDCLATSDRQGMVEMVQNAETLRKIQQNSNFLAGAFNPKAIDNYIRLWNTSELEYKTALDKFLHSCAGYSVATYILGICDRHNDNIMVTNSGHLFHIDFGKFLGDAQMMGSIKRDRTPFVLTADMAYVINGGDRPSKKFQTFIELCAMGFNIIRRHRNLFLNLFSLMSSAKINGLNSESVKYIDKMLMPNLTEPEAMAKFTRLIDECLNSRSTQVNFFIHNLAQLRFSNDISNKSILSFVPKTFSIHTDGKIESLNIIHMYKKYEQEKQYYYVVRVKRFAQPDATDITRTFREFSELQMKLNSHFPCYNFHDINKSTSSFLMDFVGRNNTREIAERRLIELRTFLQKLLILPPEISQCDLIYTFFHPILRDQSTSIGDISMMSESSSTFGSQEYSDTQRNALYLGSNGQVKLSLSYKNAALSIMIMHAKNLACPDGSAGPNCYAKTYLLPDPHKQTKRKTRVVRQSCHPSFMELIVYNISLDKLRQLTLQVSIWHSELVQYKVFMGAALIPMDKVDLSKEVIAWHPLKNF